MYSTAPSSTYIGEPALPSERAGIRARGRTRLRLPSATDCALYPGGTPSGSHPQILEFYAATEGNFSPFNSKEDPVGRIPPLLAHRFPASTEGRYSGFGPLTMGLHRLHPREVGEAIGRIGTADRGGGPFEGYTTVETEKKILRIWKAMPGSAPAI
jgi:fatty-acyl-CoA synthase